MTRVHEGLSYPYDVSDGPCSECGANEPCMEHEGKMLCYEHWHEARERGQCWKVRVKHPGGIPEDLQVTAERLTSDSCSYTEAEAKKRALKLSSEDRQYEAVPWPSWGGSRIGHPGYLSRRRKAVAEKLRAQGLDPEEAP